MEGFNHQCPANGKHLLLSTAQSRSANLAAVCQFGKEVVNTVLDSKLLYVLSFDMSVSDVHQQIMKGKDVCLGEHIRFPALAISKGSFLDISMLFQRILPPFGGVKPMIERINVVLPIPFRPSTATHS